MSAATSAVRTVRAGVYVRISADTVGKGLGVARQEADCRKLVDRRDWTVAEVYTDNDVSAFSGKVRPGYRRLLDDVRAGKVDAVVAWHPDRLHRSPRELEDFIDLIESSGAVVATCTSGDYDLGNPDGRLMARIVGSVARKESEDKSRRLRRKHLELAEGGQLSGGGRRPFGYEADRVTVRDEEADLVREAVRRVLSGDSVRAIVLDWNRRGVITVTGASWSPTTLKRLLMSGRIAGQRSHHGRPVADASWSGLVSLSEAERVRAILGRRTATGGGVTPRSYLLSGIVHCGGCGARLTARPVKRKGNLYRRYVCAVDRGGCGRVGIGAAPLEELIAEAVLTRLDRTPEMAGAMGEAGDEKLAQLVAAVAEDREALSDLTEARFVDRIISQAEFANARALIEARLEELEGELAQRSISPTSWAGEGEQLRMTWSEIGLDRQRAVVSTIIERIAIAPTTRANNRFDPTRVDVLWRTV